MFVLVFYYSLKLLSIVEVEISEFHGGEIETVGDFNAEVLHIHRVLIVELF
jgi:hypothetical protein